MKYKHLFFDLDHTLWDFETNAKNTLEQLFNEYNLSIHIENFDRFFNAYSHHNKLLWQQYEEGLLPQEELKWKRMYNALQDFNAADEILAKEMSHSFLAHLPYRKVLFPYTIEILTYLKKKGYQLHLITNGFNTVQFGKIKTAAIDHFFVEVITSESSNSLKPHKAIFDYALAKCNAESTECLMIGDNPLADIQGGINAGIDTVYVNHINKESEIPATYSIKHLKELEEIL